ncbi:MAG: serine hydrolase [Thermodesulfobacteriota bacterium]|nr:serine hydrolase [Thermodesulfobacteriota bacterium]
MRYAISDKVFPGAVLLIARNNSIVFFESYGYANIFSKRKMTIDTIFDLASLTKPLATTLAVMRLVQQHKLGLEQTLESILPCFKKTDKGRIKIKSLLCHNSGLPAYRKYYYKLSKLPPDARTKALKSFFVKEAMLHPTGKEVLYSDLGFMILGWVVETVAGERLDLYVNDEIYRPLGIDSGRGLFFVDLNSKPIIEGFAATEICPWRNILLEGVVHDENAYVMGGVAGHAGLFGTAGSLHILLSSLLSDFHGSRPINLFGEDLLHIFFKQRGGTDKTFGFETPSLTNSSCGDYFSKRSVGHLGFTGTSFWMDTERNIIVILLTNRVHPSRENDKIKFFRPKVHNAVMDCLLN